MMTAKEIKEMALRCGACELIEKADSIADLIGLMATPQGREFCKKHSFPTLDMLRERRGEITSLGVYVDAGDIEIDDMDNVVIAGDTCAILRYKQSDKPYHAIVMHGAKAKVIAYGYSICQIENIGGEIEKHESKNASIFLN